MSLKFPNGAQFAISTALGSAIAASAISNANPAEITVATGALTAGDILVVTSDHPLLNNLATKAGAVSAGATDDVELLGLNTSDAAVYDIDEATISVQKATNFVNFTQQGDPSTSGGEQQFWQGVFLEDRTGKQLNVPTFKNAKVLTLPLFYDPSLPWHAAARAADIKRVPVVIRCALPDGDELYRYGYISYDGEPSMAANNPMGVTATFTSLGDVILVPAA